MRLALSALKLVEIRELSGKNTYRNRAGASFQSFGKVLPEIGERDTQLVRPRTDGDHRRRTISLLLIFPARKSIPPKADRDLTISVQVVETAPVFTSARVLIELNIVGIGNARFPRRGGQHNRFARIPPGQRQAQRNIL